VCSNQRAVVLSLSLIRHADPRPVATCGVERSDPSHIPHCGSRRCEHSRAFLSHSAITDQLHPGSTSQVPPTHRRYMPGLGFLRPPLRSVDTSQEELHDRQDSGRAASKPKMTWQRAMTDARCVRKKTAKNNKKRQTPQSYPISMPLGSLQLLLGAEPPTTSRHFSAVGWIKTEYLRYI